MSQAVTPWIVGVLAAILAAAFAWLVRLPLPFPGFAAIVAAGAAGLGTLTLVAWLPPRLVWTEAERLWMAFQARHGLPASTAELALTTIGTAHGRAERLRRSASDMREEMADKVTGLADRLDTAAREIFYVPDRQRDLRAVLVRSELIEEAARAHAALRRRNHAPTEAESRAKLSAAIDALEAAFGQTDLLAARGLLQEVTVASDVAEHLLTPRRTADLRAASDLRS